MVKIGRLELETGAVDEAALLSSAGVRPERMAQVLRGYTSAGVVAAALNACLSEPRERADLARRISAEGVDSVRREVLALYDPSAAPKRKGGKRGKAKA